MTPPKRPPVKLPKIPGWEDPKPIGQHPHAGQLGVVIAFRQTSDHATADDWREWWEWRIRYIAGKVRIADLDIATHVIGAAGEASEHEGAYGPLAHTEDDIDTVRTARDQDNVETRGRL